jgi:hypothetical protein
VNGATGVIGGDTIVCSRGTTICTRAHILIYITLEKIIKAVSDILALFATCFYFLHPLILIIWVFSFQDGG